MDAGQRPADLRALILCFTLGVLAVHALRELPPLSWLAAAALPLLLPFRWRWHTAMLLLGALLTVWQAQRQLAERWPESRHNEELRVRGHVATLPELKLTMDRHGEPVRTWRFQFQPEDDALPLTRVSWYRGETEPRAGECWTLQLRLKTPRGSFNPADFDYEGWLFRQGIGATATVKEGERCDAPPRYPVQRWRQRIVEQIRQALPDHAGAGLVAALTVGDDSGLRDADWEVFRLTGTTHLVVISGFNLGIIAGVAFFIFRWLWSLWPPLCLRVPAQKIGMFGSALAATLYALLAGFEPPVFRALLMLLFVLAALLLYRLAQPSRVLALAWFVILLLDPFAVMSPGLWLSFGAVAAIAYIATHHLRPPGWLRGFVSLQWMLAVVLAPLSLFNFYGASLSGPLVNLLAVPWFALLTPLVLLALLLQAIGIEPLIWVADLLVWTRTALAIVAEAPGLWLAAGPPPAELALALFGAVLLFAPRRLPLWLPGLLCFAPLFWPPVQAPREGVQLTALDVGQGLAVVVRTPNHVLLFDTGPAYEDGFDAGRSVVAPYLLASGIRDLDLLLLSHGDNDHTGGADAVRRLLSVRREMGADTGQACRDGGRWDWDGVQFELLHPEAEHWSDNNASCVLRVSVGSHSVLLTGDIERGAEARLLRERADRLKADVLLAPHHGSKTSSTEKFVDAVNPKIVIHSAGWRHHYGHPHPAVQARYADIGAQQFHTGGEGALSLRITAEGVSEIQAHRNLATRWWNGRSESLNSKK